MAEINLLPTDLGLDEKTSKLVEQIKRIAIVEFALLVTLVVVTVGSIFLLSGRIDESLNKQNEKKSSIKSLEATEQRLILLKDRIDKSKKILSADTAVDEVSEFKILDDSLPTGVVLKESEISSGKLSINYGLESSLALVDFVNLLKTSGQFKTVELQSIDYTVENGYTANVVLSR